MSVWSPRAWGSSCSSRWRRPTQRSRARARGAVSAFPRGTRWILALKRLREPAAPDYTISICGDFWLEVRGDRAVGRILVSHHGRSREAVPLADMLAWVRSGGAGEVAPSGPVLPSPP